MRAAKAADVQRVAAAYLLPDNRTLGLFIPTATPKRPPAPVLVEVAPMVKDYKGDAAVVAGEAFEATTANIESRTQRAQLADGLRIALMPKRTRGATVNARLLLHFGDEKALFGTGTTGSLTAAMLNRGADGMTREQIQDAFDKLKARVALAADRMTVSIEPARQLAQV